MLRPIDFLVEKEFICLLCGNLQTINCFILNFFISSSKGQYILILAELLLNFVSYCKNSSMANNVLTYIVFSGGNCVVVQQSILGVKYGSTKYYRSQVKLMRFIFIVNFGWQS